MDQLNNCNSIYSNQNLSADKQIYGIIGIPQFHQLLQPSLMPRFQSLFAFLLHAVQVHEPLLGVGNQENQTVLEILQGLCLTLLF
jgi:hypothetical protein